MKMRIIRTGLLILIPVFLTVLACGSGSDGGTDPSVPQWRVDTSPTQQHLHDIDAISDSDVWCVGNNGNFVHYDGTEWSVLIGGITNDILCLDMIDTDHGWAGGGGGAAYHYDGTDWTRVDHTETTNPLRACHFTSDSSGWFVGDSGTLLRYDNGAFTSYPSPTGDDLYGVYVPTAGDGWACGKDGKVLRYRNDQWDLMTSLAQDDLNDMHFYANGEGWICGDAGTLLKISGGGFALKGIETDEGLTAIYFFEQTSGWVASGRGNFFRYDGSEWSQDYSHRSAINGMHFVAEYKGFACGNDGSILVFR